MSLLHFYRTPALSLAKKNELLSVTRQKIFPEIIDIETEHCFNIETTSPLTNEEMNIVRVLLSETFEPENFSEESFLISNPPSPPFTKGGQRKGSFIKGGQGGIIEVGPRMNFTTAWSTNVVSVCHACGLHKITRIERSRRYKLIFKERIQGVEGARGKDALRKINTETGLGLDEWDIDYYYNLFVNDIGRNPTNVECFDLGQSNSEHSRHWFFRGKLIIDGKEMPHTLMDIIRLPLRTNPGNSVIAFKDNSSAIHGYDIRTIIPERPDKPSRFKDSRLNYHIIFTAETHNFPTGVAPFPGAETGTGGRIRDVHATGKGSLVIAGTAAYCVGNLQIPGYLLPWEDPSFRYPSNLATPLEIEIEASNGASDYGNKFGEPVIQGFTRSFGLRLPDGTRRE